MKAPIAVCFFRPKQFNNESTNPMKTIKLFIPFLLLLMASCAPVDEQDAMVKATVQSLKAQYAPDRRVAVFDIKWERYGNLLAVKGEVDNPKAKEELLAALKTAGLGDLLDSIKVLPDPELGANLYGIVTISVANVRSSPGQAEELSTQVMMGMVVKLLKKRGGWYYVQSHDKYLGWLEDDAFHMTTTEGVDAWTAAHKVITTSHFALIRQRPDVRALPVSDAVAGVMMQTKGTRAGWVEVAFPDGRSGFIEQSNVEDYTRWRASRRLTPQNVENVAKMFTGVPYLWGGTSPKGMDCSGFTKTVYRLNGFELGRDANQQAEMGEEVAVGEEFDNLSKGDLVFFGRKASADRPERITHVGIYLANNEFIHAPGGASIRVNSFNPAAPHYREGLRNSFVRARRIIGAAQVPEVSR